MSVTIIVLTAFTGLLSLHLTSSLDNAPLLSTGTNGNRRRVSRRRRMRRRMERY